MKHIWILNVGDLKFLETPLEYFLSIAYDAQAVPRDSLMDWLRSNSLRDFGYEYADEIAKINALYSVSLSVKKGVADDRCTHPEEKQSYWTEPSTPLSTTTSE